MEGIGGQAKRHGYLLCLILSSIKKESMHTHYCGYICYASHHWKGDYGNCLCSRAKRKLFLSKNFKVKTYRTFRSCKQLLVYCFFLNQVIRIPEMGLMCIVICDLYSKMQGRGHCSKHNRKENLILICDVRIINYMYDLILSAILFHMIIKIHFIWGIY